ncbi:FAD-dependent monooxygenase [Aquabacterium sp. J223]|uniref:FAD-dependent monooxygenase n=1 Tax=Aquabacterium sp. J223 TaxID=2898431 RepID=UPI0021AD5B21|nr:FAD-dependent monooxygenase [Aquabacterium sp. J223]UUX97749.1 FAD-dependent monooxygenase [Aquabacterium sp. J223]
MVGAGPVGLALALQAARRLPQARITVFDARPLDRDVSTDPRTLALSLGSVQLLRQLDAFDGRGLQPITEVHVSQAPPGLRTPLGEPVVVLRAADEGVSQLGAVLSYGAVVAPLQRAWLAQAAAHPGRLATRFGQSVSGFAPMEGGVRVDEAGDERFDLAVVAEGGVFAQQASKGLRHSYHQTAWVGQVRREGGTAGEGTAFERFTRQGPVALLPLSPDGRPGHRAALVWCVPDADDPVRDLDDAQRLAVLNTLLPPEAGRLVEITPLKAFPLGLNAQPTLVDGRVVRIGNAAQTLHPVAGQGLNLGLRDAFALVDLLARQPLAEALRRFEWRRGPDRWSMILATDFLARSFTWQAPGLGTLRGLGLAALQAAGPLKSALARQMMFGRR